MSEGIHLLTEVPGPNSLAIAARRDRAGARGAARLTDVAVRSAHGAYVTDADGNRLLDFAGGIGVLTVGHTPEGVVKALKEQAEELLHLCAIVGTYEPYVELLERLTQLAPGEGPKKAVLLNSGAEALETAVKIARAHTGRQAIVVFEGGYHGRTNLTLGMTSKYALFKKGFGPYASEIYRLPFPDTYRRPSAMSEEEYLESAIKDLERAMIAQIDPHAVAAFVIEPVQGEAGFLPVPAAFMRRLREISSESGALLVADEVQSGLGRTGTLWATEQMGVTPDLTCTAKALAAGMPLAAVVGPAEIMDAPHPGGLGGTYSGNPLACRAALEALSEISAPAFLKRAREIGEQLKEGLEKIAQNHPQIGDVRGLGPMLALEFVKDPITKEPDQDLVLSVTKEALKRGLIVIRAGLYSNCIRLLPPLNMSNAEIEEGLSVLGEAVSAAITAATPSGADTGRAVQEKQERTATPTA